MKGLQLTDQIKRYEYQLGENRSCIFDVTNVGLITIRIPTKGFIKMDDLLLPFQEVTKLVQERGLIPQINIVKSNHFLQCLARKCGYKMIPAGKISFNIWKYQS